MEPTPIILSWWDILKFALSTGVATALANNLLEWCRDWRKETTTVTRDARYLAMRIVVILEKFAIDCADSISDNDFYSQSGGHAGTQHTTLPSLAEYPKDADWKALDPALSVRALSFHNELLLSKSAIIFWYDVEPECVPNACDDQAGKCGYRAWQLAVEMRDHYKLPIFNPKQTAWDVVKLLKKHHDTALKKAKEAAET